MFLYKGLVSGLGGSFLVMDGKAFVGNALNKRTKSIWIMSSNKPDWISDVDIMGPSLFQNVGDINI